MKRILSIFANLFLTGTDLACADDLVLSDNKFPCGEAPIHDLYGLFLAKPGQSITAASTVPTPAEITTAMGLSTDAKVVCVMPIYDAVKASEQMTVNGPDGLREVVAEKITITAKVKNLHDEVIDAMRQMNIRQRFQLWYVDDQGTFFGAKAGYRAAIYFPDWTKENGKGVKAEIAITIEYFRDLTVTHVTAKAAGYLDLNNV
jgi:hypothetical protein